MELQMLTSEVFYNIKYIYFFYVVFNVIENPQNVILEISNILISFPQFFRPGWTDPGTDCPAQKFHKLSHSCPTLVWQWRGIQRTKCFTLLRYLSNTK